MAFWNRKYKDSVFTDLFGTDKTGKENFLALYNALSGNDFKLQEVSLERKVIEQSLYKTFNNDVSWEINGKLIILVEHQSTVNENMPLRCLEYVTRIYEGISQGAQQNAVEDAIVAVREFNATPEFAAQKMNAPLELVIEALKQNK